MSEEGSIHFSFKPKKITGSFKAPLPPQVKEDDKKENDKKTPSILKTLSNNIRPLHIQNARAKKYMKDSSSKIIPSVPKAIFSKGMISSTSSSIRELDEITKKLSAPVVPKIKKELLGSVHNFKPADRQETRDLDVEDNTIELITSFKKRIDFGKKKLLDAQEKNKELVETISQKDAEILKQTSRIDELEKKDAISSYFINNNVAEDLRLKQKVDIIENGMERFEYIILKVKQLLEEAQKHKEDASKETTKLIQVMVNNHAETKEFKKKGNGIIQNVRNVQNDYLKEIESFKEMRTVVKSEFDTIKNCWRECQDKMLEYESNQSLINQQKEILQEFSYVAIDLVKKLECVLSTVQILEEKYINITSMDEKVKDLMHHFEKLKIESDSPIVRDEILLQTHTEKTNADRYDETQNVNSDAMNKLKLENEALITYVRYLQTQIDSFVQAKNNSEVPTRTLSPLTITSQVIGGRVPNQVTQPKTTVSLSKKRGRKLKNSNESSDYWEVPSSSTNSRYLTRGKSRALIQSQEDDVDIKTIEECEKMKKRKVRKLNGYVHDYELEDSDEADIPKKKISKMDIALPESKPQISITKN